MLDEISDFESGSKGQAVERAEEESVSRSLNGMILLVVADESLRMHAFPTNVRYLYPKRLRMECNIESCTLIACLSSQDIIKYMPPKDP